ncbi:MAG: Ig-like domain-containing protein [Lachnospiraceae bacterium]|nr:Ig-like domain-containing protein [Lachnospiraceae bacterium]
MGNPSQKTKHHTRKPRFGGKKNSYDTARFDAEDLLELDEEDAYLREDADEIEDEEEYEDEEEPIEDLAESLDADTWDRAGSEESLTDEAEEPDEEDEELLSDEEVRSFTQKFEQIPEGIADLEAGDRAPAEYDAYDKTEPEFYDEDDEEDFEDRTPNLRYIPAPAAVNIQNRPDEEDVEEEEERLTAPHEAQAHRQSAHRRPGKRQKGHRKAASSLTTMEWAAIAMSALLLIVVVSLGVMFFRMRGQNSELQAFSEIGSDLGKLEIIGESGLIAMRDAAALRMEEVPEEEEIPAQKEEPVEEPEPEPEEEQISVAMGLTTIKSDLKIKFTNADTGKLVANLPFSVTAKSPSGKEETWPDDDMDGVIYKTGLSAGTWSIAMREPEAEYKDRYKADTKPKTATVKDKIEYKKVDVADEIKKESQVNVAAEDTEPREAAAVESVNVDTVEWVESSKEETDAGDGTYTYAEVSKSDLTEPQTDAQARKTGSGRMLRAPVIGEEGGTEEKPIEETEPVITEEKSIAVSPSEVTLEVGYTTVIMVTYTGLEGNQSFTFDISGETDTVECSIKNDTQCSVTAKKVGTAVITARADSDDSLYASCTVTVVEAEKEKKITVKPEKLSLYTGNSAELTVKLEGLEKEDLLWQTSDKEIAAVDAETGKVKGVKAGKAKITIAWRDDEDIKAVCEVTVTDGKVLKTKKGETVYVRDGDKYREATSADYYTASTFYLRSGGTKIVYHGWQTLDGHTYFFDKNGNYVTGDQIIQGVSYHFASDGILSGGAGILGVDVSKWNGSIDWKAVKNSGVNYAIIRCGFRGTSTGVLVEDSMFHSNMRGALNAGLKVGAYFFSAAVSDVEAVEEASMAASLCSGYSLAYPVFLDVERSDSGKGRADKLGASERTAIIRAFCATMANSGYRTGLYANKNWMEEMIDTPSLSEYKLWLAQYVAQPTYTRTRFDIWQYTSKGSIKGISGKVDLNVSYLNY